MVVFLPPKFDICCRILYHLRLFLSCLLIWSLRFPKPFLHWDYTSLTASRTVTSLLLDLFNVVVLYKFSLRGSDSLSLSILYFLSRFVTSCTVPFLLAQASAVLCDISSFLLCLGSSHGVRDLCVDFARIRSRSDSVCLFDWWTRFQALSNLVMLAI